MSLMISGLYDALKDAGAKDDLARKAAQEVAGYDNRLTKMEAKLTMLQWMLGINIGMTASIIFKLFG